MTNTKKDNDEAWKDEGQGGENGKDELKKEAENVEVIYQQSRNGEEDGRGSRTKPSMRKGQADRCQAGRDVHGEQQRSLAASINWPKELTPLISQSMMLQNNPEGISKESQPINQFLSSSSRSFLFQQQMKYNQHNKQHYFPLIEKMRAYILCLELRQILRTKLILDQELQRTVQSGHTSGDGKDDQESHEVESGAHGLFFHTLEKSGQISTLKKMLKTRNAVECVQSLWSSAMAKVNSHLSVFDSEAFSSNLTWDFVSANQIIYNIKRRGDGKLNLVQQLCQGGICANLIRIISAWLKHQREAAECPSRNDYVVYIAFKIKGHHDSYRIFLNEHSRAQQKCQYTTMSIEFTKLIGLIMETFSFRAKYYDIDDQVFKSAVDKRKESLGELLTLLGADIAVMSGNFGLSLAYPEITEAVMQFYKVP
jgi:hypothetical protein